MGKFGEINSADTRAGKFPLVSMGGWAECPACADTGARTPIGASGIFLCIFSTDFKFSCKFVLFDSEINSIWFYLVLIEICEWVNQNNKREKMNWKYQIDSAIAGNKLTRNILKSDFKIHKNQNLNLFPEIVTICSNLISQRAAKARIRANWLVLVIIIIALKFLLILCL